MAYRNRTKTEHNGAKNGGGMWGTRNEAKKTSKKLRRARAKRIIRDELLKPDDR